MYMYSATPDIHIAWRSRTIITLVVLSATGCHCVVLLLGNTRFIIAVKSKPKSVVTTETHAHPRSAHLPPLALSLLLLLLNIL